MNNTTFSFPSETPQEIQNKISNFIRTNTMGVGSKKILKACVCPLSEALIAEIKNANADSRSVSGFSAIERTLLFESKGLKKVDNLTGLKRGNKISRLLLLSNDCAERFYIKVHKLVEQHSERLMVFMLDISSEDLAKLCKREGAILKSVLINHKETVAKILMSLLPSL